MAKTPTLPFAIVGANASKYSPATERTPEQWTVLKVERETPQRIYQRAAKIGWSDPYWDKGAVVVRRFATAEEAQTYIDAAKAALAGEIAEADAAREDYRRAQDRVSAAQNALRLAARTYNCANKS